MMQEITLLKENIHLLESLDTNPHSSLPSSFTDVNGIGDHTIPNKSLRNIIGRLHERISVLSRENESLSNSKAEKQQDVHELTVSLNLLKNDLHLEGNKVKEMSRLIEQKDRIIQDLQGKISALSQEKFSLMGVRSVIHVSTRQN
jgi:chromosome segregation ATPase